PRPRHGPAAIVHGHVLAVAGEHEVAHVATVLTAPVGKSVPAVPAHRGPLSDLQLGQLTPSLFHIAPATFTRTGTPLVGGAWCGAVQVVQPVAAVPRDGSEDDEDHQREHTVAEMMSGSGGAGRGARPGACRRARP